MSDKQKISEYCKAHPGQYFTYEELVRATGVCIHNVRGRMRELSLTDGFKMKKRRVPHEGRSVGKFKNFKSQSRLAWIGE